MVEESRRARATRTTIDSSVEELPHAPGATSADSRASDVIKTEIILLLRFIAASFPERRSIDRTIDRRVYKRRVTCRRALTREIRVGSLTISMLTGVNRYRGKNSANLEFSRKARHPLCDTTQRSFTHSTSTRSLYNLRDFYAA